MSKIPGKKAKEKIITRIIMAPLFIAFLYFAARLGMLGGNYLYKLDTNVITNIDSNYFKAVLNISLPIITTVYDSGNVSSKFVATLKSVVGGIFNFDINYPVSIFNSQSPLFYTYYSNTYLKSQLAQNDSTTQVPGNVASGGQTQETQLPGSNTENTGNGSTGNPNDGTGNNSEGNIGQSGSSGNENTPNLENNQEAQGNRQDRPGTGDPAVNENSNGSTGEEQPGGNTAGEGTGGAGSGNTGENVNGAGSEPGNFADNSGGTGNSGDPDISNPLEPVSSIEYEEEEDDKSGTGSVQSHGKVVVQNRTSTKIDIEKLLSEPFEITFPKKGPQMLIYHTHTKESYVLKSADLGKKDIPLYNANPLYNVVRVGDELSKNLKKYGFNVLHNGTVHDTVHASAYSASLKTLQEYIKSNPSLKVFFDIHRDGLASDKPKLRVTTTIDKKTVAQIMFVVTTGNERLPNPNWKENLKFALHLQQKLNEKYPGFARPILISSNRYNQHLSTGSLLIEIGGDGNLLDECIESTKYLAWAVNEVINGK